MKINTIKNEREKFFVMKTEIFNYLNLNISFAMF